MAIYQYSRTFWYPNGTLATGIPVRVFQLNTPALAPLFTDATGTVPLANPVTTTGAGVASFYAEEGEYWLHADAESFRVSVGSPDVDLFEVTGSDMSTGIISGGELSVNGLNPAAIDISAVVGYVVDEATDPDNPGVTRVDVPGSTVALDAGGLARTTTWWLMSSTGVVTQQATKPTNTQRRTSLVLGVTAQDAGIIFVDQSLPVIMAQPANQLADLMDALGAFVITGNLVTPNGANLNINQSAGTLFSRAFNHYSGPSLTRDPHVSTTQAQTQAQFRYITATGLVFGPLRNTVDVANFDNGGVITPLGGGVGTSSIHRVWLFATNTAAAQLAIQYGQTSYTSLANAIDAIGQSGHVVNPLILGNGALIAHIVATRVATNLSDTAQARIFAAGKFATP